MNIRLHTLSAASLALALLAPTQLHAEESTTTTPPDPALNTVEPATTSEDAAPQPLPLVDGFTDFDDQASYSVGLMVGQLIQRELISSGMGDNLNLDQITQGLHAAMGKAEPKLTEAQLRDTMMAYQQIAQEGAMKKNAELAEQNTAEGLAFLTTNKAAEGVVELPSGLQYKITQPGTGPKPQPTDTVSIHYTGKLLDGTTFDSSIERGQPASFPLDRVIPGFSEGLAQLPVGSKATLYIPGNMAYGPNPQPGSPIGPNALLVFDVELLGIDHAPAPTE